MTIAVSTNTECSPTQPLPAYEFAKAVDMFLNRTWATITLSISLSIGMIEPGPVRSQSPPEPESTAAVADAPTKPAEAATIPLVVRIDRSYLAKFICGDVEVRLPVDQVVLGTRAVGGSHTRGTLHAALIPDSTEAAFDVRYTGNTATKTVGTNGPAVIHSRTFTEFACSRRVLFDPRKGFVLDGEPVVDGHTQLIYDGFDASRDLGRRLIARIAERRAYASYGQARLIADRDNMQKVRDGFAKDVEKAISQANADNDFVRYVNRFFGKDTPLQVFAKSSTECIQIGIGTVSEKYHPLTALPSRGERTAPIEVWVHPSLLSDVVSPLTVLSQSKLLGDLSLPLTPSDAPISVAVEEAWLVFGLQGDSGPAANGELKVASQPIE